MWSILSALPVPCGPGLSAVVARDGTPDSEVVARMAQGPLALFMIPVLFLVAGLLTPPSLQRKGPGRFACDRLLRLGVPFALFTFLLSQ